MIKKLDWDSHFFGLKIGQYEESTLSEKRASGFYQEFKKAGFDCVYFFLDPNDPESLATAERHRLFLVDVRMHYELAKQDGADLRSPGFHLLDPHDSGKRRQVLLMSEDLARASRFYFDRRFRPKAAKMYKIWAEKMMADKDSAVIMNLKKKGEVIGFAACTVKGELGELVLVYVAEQARGRGIGEEVVKAGVEWSLNRGAKRVTVKTQLRNVAANRLYQKAGFVITESRLIYHAWRL